MEPNRRDNIEDWKVHQWWETQDGDVAACMSRIGEKAPSRYRLYRDGLIVAEATKAADW